MNCYFHEANESIQICMKCNKPLCRDCIHTEYPEYCWSCGLDYDNSFFRDPGIQMPRFFEKPIVFYILRKLFSATGSCIIFTFLFCIYFWAIGMSEVTSIAFWVALFTSLVVNTYGIISSLLIDITTRFIRILNRWYFIVILYFILGSLFPIIFNLQNGFSRPANMAFGTIASLIFWGLQNKKIKKELVIILGLLSLVPTGVATIILIKNSLIKVIDNVLNF
jgi:hypothetical protein